MEFLQLPVFTLLYYAIPFLIALLAIIFVHEMGHFLVGRWCGIGIEVFSLGFGKEIVGWYDKRGTRWKICWIPLGGYVKFEGDANAASIEKPATTVAEQKSPTRYHSKSALQRSAVVAAGPIANFLFAILIFAATFFFWGEFLSQPRGGRSIARQRSKNCRFAGGRRVQRD